MNRPPRKPIGRKPAIPPTRSQALALGHSARFHAWRRYRRIYSYRALNDFPLVVSYGLSVPTILRPWVQQAWRDGSLLLAGLAALAGIAFVLNRLERRRLETESNIRIAAAAFEAQQGIVVTGSRRSDSPRKSRFQQRPAITPKRWWSTRLNCSARTTRIDSTLRRRSPQAEHNGVLER